MRYRDLICFDITGSKTLNIVIAVMGHLMLPVGLVTLLLAYYPLKLWYVLEKKQGLNVRDGLQGG